MRELAESFLKKALGNPEAAFRKDQWECVAGILSGKRQLVVQRTGWGKSMVYFIATRLLRMSGRGPTLLISPLLSLMRNQIEAAQRLGLNAMSINSANRGQWQTVAAELEANAVDLLLVSPERLANAGFREGIFAGMAPNLALFVVDEAHCISDWGHDFRPDYRLILRFLQLLPANVPVLATTATANDRVLDDIRAQLGEDLIVRRGSLLRKSLRLQNIHLPGIAPRLAWLAQNIPFMPGSGIVYTLTRRDAELVARWLGACGISARAYHAGEESGESRAELEELLLKNRIKALVATVALGMGFDKPDLGFVVHYQRPASLVHYYQQVGRAGRGLDEALGILLCGEEDDSIADYFRESAFPIQRHVASILEVLAGAEDGFTLGDIQRRINLGKGQIEKTLKFLALESPAPVIRLESRWHLTYSAAHYRIDRRRIDAVTRIRLAEQKQMKEYAGHSGCLMNFLQKALDDPSPAPCGKCENCDPAMRLEAGFDEKLSRDAAAFIKSNFVYLDQKRYWPAANVFAHYPISGYAIDPEHRAETGRALCLWRDAGYGGLVADNKYKDGRFSQKLVAACAQMLRDWAPDPAPAWLTCAPSRNRPGLVPDFARRLALELGLPLIVCLEKIRQNSEQKRMKNSWQQARNLDGAFYVHERLVPDRPCWLVDDVVNSGWTMTVLAALLRMAGCPAVYPVALALNTTRLD